MQIVTQFNQIAASRVAVSGYRSRLRKQAKALLKAQSNGKCLRNQQRKIVERWQKLEAGKRGAA